MTTEPLSMPSNIVEINGDTPTLRLFALLEVIASKDQYFSLQGLADATALPKPTLHRMLRRTGATMANLGRQNGVMCTRFAAAGNRSRRLLSADLLKKPRTNSSRTSS